ncbi:pirin family protein [Entomomonas asaccharolytica]|uniref:Pirin family protein n=1 Tax=Entomomonas asaccharolytica TaxID=2785331 RepID=A0A974NF36_9GAMM|nr:pirin family protein [Entomomonas asaccharolytica]QQP85262.1 pirin family protein [Entomomonas asaccharolytica]
MLNTILHKANERGHAQHGWLDSYHSFSFANYFNPEKINFGALRVINEDRVLPGEGFATHSHNNMEIISIPLSGALEHKDSMGNTSVIQSGEIQVISAGTGILHSEYNASHEELVHFLQIWIIPNQNNVTPRYQQIKFDEKRLNEFQQIVSPNPNDEGAWIHQQAWFSLGHFNQLAPIEYKLHDRNNGVYVFIIQGEAMVGDSKLLDQDALGITGETAVKITPAKTDTRILLIEVPM